MTLIMTKLGTPDTTPIPRDAIVQRPDNPQQCWGVRVGRGPRARCTQKRRAPRCMGESQPYTCIHHQRYEQDARALQASLDGYVLRVRGCVCQWEEGDSPCPVHGDDD